MRVELIRVSTTDGLTLHGAYAAPQGRKRVGVLYIHGLTSNFYFDTPRWEAIAKTGRRSGIGVLALNTRGHDILTSFKRRRGKKTQRLVLGAAAERFQDSIHDVRAGIQFLKTNGYRKVILVGHSTGANKALYAASKIGGRSVTGVVLAGGVSDIAMRKKELGENFNRNIVAVRRFAKRFGKDTFLPRVLSGGHWTAGRYLSLFDSDSAENVFPYPGLRSSWRTLRAVRVPILVVLGKEDEYLDRPASDVAAIMLANAQNPRRFQAELIDGANHGFYGKERVFANAVIRWIEEL